MGYAAVERAVRILLIEGKCAVTAETDTTTAMCIMGYGSVVTLACTGTMTRIYYSLESISACLTYPSLPFSQDCTSPYDWFFFRRRGSQQTCSKPSFTRCDFPTSNSGCFLPLAASASPFSANMRETRRLMMACWFTTHNPCNHVDLIFCVTINPTLLPELMPRPQADQWQARW
jgi:hypothetical protein